MNIILNLIIICLLVSCSSAQLSDDISNSLVRQHIDNSSDDFYQYIFYTTMVDENDQFVGYSKNGYTRCLNFKTEKFNKAIVQKFICNRLYNKIVKDPSELSHHFKPMSQ